MKSTTILVASFLATAVVAQPKHHHQHQQLHKRAQEVVWVTVTDSVTETIPVTTTIWVSPGFVAPGSSTSSSSSSSPAAGQFFQAAGGKPTPATSAVVIPPTSSSSSAYVAPTPTTPTTTTPAYVAPPTPTTSAYVAPSSTPVSSSSGSGECSQGSPCSGDITHYTAGLGACGYTNDGATDAVVALPAGLMGTLSSGDTVNPYCGRHIMVTCTNTGKSVTAKVVDKCPGCSNRSIDLSDNAFNQIEDPDVGRTGSTWYFLD